MVYGSATRSNLNTQTRPDASLSKPSTDYIKEMDGDGDGSDGFEEEEDEEEEDEEKEEEEEEDEEEEEEEEVEEVESEKKPCWIEFLTNLEQASREYESKSKLPNGTYVEDILADYAETLEPLNVAHWMIIDSDDARLKALLLSNGWEGSFSLPQLPEALNEHISKYANVG